MRQLAKLHASGINYKGHVLAHARNWPRGLLSNTTQALPALGVILFEANARDVPPAVALAVLLTAPSSVGPGKSQWDEGYPGSNDQIR